MTVEIISWSISTKVWDRAGMHCLLDKNICKDKNASFYKNFDQQPLKLPYTRGDPEI